MNSFIDQHMFWAQCLYAWEQSYKEDGEGKKWSSSVMFQAFCRVKDAREEYKDAVLEG